MPKLSRSVDIACNGKTFLDKVVMEFERYVDFVSDLKGVKIIASKGDMSQVEFLIHVLRDIRYTLQLTREDENRVTWFLLKGDFMKKNTGSWRVTDHPDGTATATYTIELQLPFFVPGSVTKMLTERSLPTMLEAFRSRADHIKE